MVSTTSLKAIETQYNGYRFRSRLEARWAVFFDALSINYEYEKEGFDLGGTWYLPDFWLPDFRYWVEIKPSLANDNDWPEDDVMERIEKLEEATGHRAFVLCGSPWKPREPNSYQGFAVGDNDHYWCECDDCGSMGIQWMGMSERNPHTPGCREERRKSGAFSSDKYPLAWAYDAARGARFEHLKGRD